MMNPQLYQEFKLIVIGVVELSRDAIHIHVGFFALIATLLLTRKRLHQASVLLGPFLLSSLMELLDLWSDLSTGRGVHAMASLHDLINTNLIPVVLYFWARREHLRVK